MTAQVAQSISRKRASKLAIMTAGNSGANIDRTSEFSCRYLMLGWADQPPTLAASANPRFTPLLGKRGAARKAAFGPLQPLSALPLCRYTCSWEAAASAALRWAHP